MIDATNKDNSGHLYTVVTISQFHRGCQGLLHHGLVLTAQYPGTVHLSRA